MPVSADRLTDWLDVLASAGDRTERIQMLIDAAGRYRGVPERIATRPYASQRRVPACESEVYVWAEELPEGTLGFHFAVENPQGLSAKALAVILDDSFSGTPLEQVASADPDLIFSVFGDELSMGKSMGLGGMVNMVRMYARRAIGDRGLA